jgi:hypothetical protein
VKRWIGSLPLLMCGSHILQIFSICPGLSASNTSLHLRARFFAIS